MRAGCFGEGSVRVGSAGDRHTTLPDGRGPGRRDVNHRRSTCAHVTGAETLVMNTDLIRAAWLQYTEESVCFAESLVARFA
jgi:hypothetical protein